MDFDEIRLSLYNVTSVNFHVNTLCDSREESDNNRSFNLRLAELHVIWEMSQFLDTELHFNFLQSWEHLRFDRKCQQIWWDIHSYLFPHQLTATTMGYGWWKQSANGKNCWFMWEWKCWKLIPFWRKGGSLSLNILRFQNIGRYLFNCRLKN